MLAKVRKMVFVIGLVVLVYGVYRFIESFTMSASSGLGGLAFMVEGAVFGVIGFIVMLLSTVIRNRKEKDV